MKVVIGGNGRDGWSLVEEVVVNRGRHQLNDFPGELRVLDRVGFICGLVRY